MNNPLRTPEDYELFLYTLIEPFPTVRRSTARTLTTNISHQISNTTISLHQR